MACRWGLATAGLVVRAAAAMSLASNPMRTGSSTVLWRSRGSSSRMFFGPPYPRSRTATGTRQMNSQCGDVARAAGAPTVNAPIGADGPPLPRMAPPSNDSVRHAHSARTGPLWSSVAAFLGWTEERARELIEFGGVYYKPGTAPASAKPKREIDPERQVEVGEYFRVYPIPKRFPACMGVDWESKIVYESGGVMLVNKPAGVPAHATVDNFVENMLAGLRGVRPGVELFLPHRLDIDTSGLVIVVKDLETLGSVNDLIRAPGLSLQTGAAAERARRARERALRRARKAQNKALRQHAQTTSLNEDGDVRVPSETDGAAGVFSASSSSSDGGVGDRRGGGAIHKRYRALVEVLPGKSALKASEIPLTHFLKVSSRAPKEFRRKRPKTDAPSITNSEETRSEENDSCTEEESWIECRLRVLSASEVRFSSSGASEVSPSRATAGISETGGFSEKAPRMLQEVEVELLTGRTHQIRGQLAAEGCPIYGDLLYGPAVSSGRTATNTTKTAASSSIATPKPAPMSAARQALATAPASSGPTGGRFVLRRAEPSLSPPPPREEVADRPSLPLASPALGGDSGTSSMNNNPGNGNNGELGGGTSSERDVCVFPAVGDVEGGRVGSDLGGFARQLQTGFVDSPKMALQACHISLEFEGEGGMEQHSFTLGRDACWWVTLGQ